MSTPIVLRKYQKEDLHRWAHELNCRGGLYWAPGLGKTFVTIKLLERMLAQGITKKVLAIVPATLVTMWRDELEKSNLLDRTFVFKPKNRVKKKDPKEPSKEHQVHLISYHMFMQKFKKPEEFWAEGYDFWVLDESHNIKSHTSKVFKFLYIVNRMDNKLLLLSGTPFPQGRTDCYSQLSLISPGCVGRNISDFRAKYCLLLNKDFYKYAFNPRYDKVVDDITYNHCCFRTVEDEKIDIPPMTSITVGYELTPAQADLYRLVKRDKIITYIDAEGKSADLPITMPAIRMWMCQQIASGVVHMTHLATTKG